MVVNLASSDRMLGSILQVNSEALLKACPIPFHEGRLWKGEDAPALRQQLQASFQNITSIMDCVGCEKCKLWGKLQLMGACLLVAASAWVVTGQSVYLSSTDMRI